MSDRRIVRRRIEQLIKYTFLERQDSIELNTLANAIISPNSSFYTHAATCISLRSEIVIT